MIKICFIPTTIDGESVIIAAHELDYQGSTGSYIAYNRDKFETFDTEQKLECLNDLLIALIRHVEIKDKIDFKQFSRPN